MAKNRPQETPAEIPSASSELASMIEKTGSIDPEHLKEAPIDLESARADAPISKGVVIPAAVLVGLVVAFGLGMPRAFQSAASSAFTWVIDSLGWAFVLFGTVFVIFILVLAVSKFGSIRLGRSDERPEFSTPSWIAMMFAAGMGIGLMFYGASEPLAFYVNGVPGHDVNDASTALATAMYHWTLHPWALYAVVGLAVGYATFRKGRKQLISSAFVPLVGEKAANGWFGKFIDILAIVATVFGTACSLGLGALQIRAGLVASGLVENPGMNLIIMIVGILTCAYLISALSGVGNGIRILSNTNMILAAALAIFVFALGAMIAQLDLLPAAIGTYLDQFFEMAGRTAAAGDGTAGEWLSGWTIFYWAWWISWSPFVGMFLARISRGRSIREFCVGVMLVPSGLSTVWFVIFGGTAITMEQNGQSIVGDGPTEAQLFNMLHLLPGGFWAGILAILLLGTFYVTSADSASTVMGSMSQSGRSEASRWVVALWGLLSAFVGLTLLLVGGNEALNSVQTVTIVAATPFLFVLVGLMFATVKDLSNDVVYLDQRETERFSQQLAIERRHLRERAELEAELENRPQVRKLVRLGERVASRIPERLRDFRHSGDGAADHDASTENRSTPMENSEE